MTLRFFRSYGFIRAFIGSQQIGSISDRCTLAQVQEWEATMRQQATR